MPVCLCGFMFVWLLCLSAVCGCVFLCLYELCVYVIDGLYGVYVCAFLCLYDLCVCMVIVPVWRLGLYDIYVWHLCLCGFYVCLCCLWLYELCLYDIYVCMFYVYMICMPVYVFYIRLVLCMCACYACWMFMSVCCVIYVCMVFMFVCFLRLFAASRGGIHCSVRLRKSYVFPGVGEVLPPCHCNPPRSPQALNLVGFWYHVRKKNTYKLYRHNNHTGITTTET